MAARVVGLLHRYTCKNKKKNIYLKKKNAPSHPEREEETGNDLAAALRSVARPGASILGLNVKVGQDRCGWLS